MPKLLMAKPRTSAVVGVDAGTIAISLDEDLEHAGRVYADGMDRSCWTAWVIWDGHCGGVKTPHGDGSHEVVLKELKERNRIKDLVRLYNGSRDQVRGGNRRLFVGDCGRVDGWIDLPTHVALYLAWDAGKNILWVLHE